MHKAYMQAPAHKHRLTHRHSRSCARLLLRVRCRRASAPTCVHTYRHTRFDASSCYFSFGVRLCLSLLGHLCAEHLKDLACLLAASLQHLNHEIFTRWRCRCANLTTQTSPTPPTRQHKRTTKSESIGRHVNRMLFCIVHSAWRPAQA